MLAGLREVITNRKATLSSLGAVIGSQLLAGVLGGAASLVLGRFIDPEVLGYFSAFAILTQYLCLLNIGWIAALHREYPYWIGKGEPERANRILAVCESWVLLIGRLVAALYTLLALGSLLLGDFTAAAAWAAQLATASLSFYVTYLACTYRSANEFVTWSKLSAATSIVSFLLLPLVALLGFWGLCIRAAVPASLSGWLLHRFRPVRIAPQWDLHELWRLVKFGLAMDLSGFLATACVTATMASLVAANYGLAVLGLLAFARTGEAFVAQFAIGLVSVFVPRIHQQMGVTDSLRHCALYSLRPMLAAVCATVPLVLGASILCEPLIRVLAPKYIDCVPILRVCLWAAVCPGLAIPTYALIAARHTWAIAIGNVACFAIFIAIAGAAVLLRLPPLYVAVGYLVGNLANVLVCLGILWAKVRSSEAPAANRGAISPSMDSCGGTCDVGAAVDGWTRFDL